MAYFIASKCFAAKTGFPNRCLDVAQFCSSKCLLLFEFVHTDELSRVCLLIVVSVAADHTMKMQRCFNTAENMWNTPLISQLCMSQV